MRFNLMKKTINALCAGLTLLLLTAGMVKADIVVTDMGGDNYLVTLDPIVFTVGTNQSAGDRFVVEDFFASNAPISGVHLSGTVNWTRNADPTIVIDLETVSGVFQNTLGQIDPNDLFINFISDYTPSGAGAITAGDTITLSTTNMMFNAPGLPAANSGPFTAHLLNDDTSIATGLITTVPEPSTIALLALAGLVGVASTRRRKRV